MELLQVWQVGEVQGTFSHDSEEKKKIDGNAESFGGRKGINFRLLKVLNKLQHQLKMGNMSMELRWEVDYKGLVWRSHCEDTTDGVNNLATAVNDLWCSDEGPADTAWL